MRKFISKTPRLKQYVSAHLGVRIRTVGARTTDDSGSAATLSGLAVATRPKTSGHVALARYALLTAGRLIMILLAVALAGGLVAGRIVALSLVAVTGPAYRGAPPGSRTGLIGPDIAITARVLG